MASEDDKKKFHALNQKRAKVIEEVMKLRYEQAELKTQIIELAAKSNDTSLAVGSVMCW